MSEAITKEERLSKDGARHPHPGKVTAEIVSRSVFFDPHDLVQMKYEMLRHVDVDEAPVTEAARSFGLSRVSFYEARRHYTEGGVAGLLPRKRGPKGPYKMTEEIMTFIQDLIGQSEGKPNWKALSRRIEEEFGLTVHPRSIERRIKQDTKKGAL